jgi:hypothetical protein
VIQVTIRNKKQLARPEDGLAPFNERMLLIEREGGGKEIAFISKGSNDHKIVVFLRGTVKNGLLNWILVSNWQPLLNGKETIYDISDCFTFGVNL